MENQLHGGALPPEEVSPMPPPPFNNPRLLHAEAILCPNLLDPSIANLETLCNYIDDSERYARQMLRDPTTLDQLQTTYRTAPYGLYSIRARNLLLAEANLNFWDTWEPEKRDFVADTAMDGLRDMMRTLYEILPDQPNHPIVERKFSNYNMLLHKLVKEGGWKPRHTHALGDILYEYPGYAPLVTSNTDRNQACLEHLGLPAKLDGVHISHDTRIVRDDQQWFRSSYTLWRTFGIERQVPGSAAALYQQFGLRTFGCTTHNHVERMYRQRHTPPRRTSLALVPSPAMDGAYQNSLILYEKMHEGQQDADWFIVEYASVKELTERLDHLYEQWGDRIGAPDGIAEVPFISMLGHGRHTHINVNPQIEGQREVAERLDVTTMQNTIGPRLRKLSLPGTSIILDTCEPAAGKRNLADAARLSTGRRIIAPEGFTLLKSAQFLAGAAGELAVQVQFLGLVQVGRDEYKSVDAGRYEYPPLG